MHPVLMRQLAARRGMTPSGDQAQLPRPGDGLGTVGRAEFAQDVADVLLDGVEGDHEVAGDSLIRPAHREHLKDFELAAGQRVDDDGRNGITPEPPGVEGPLEAGQVAERDLGGEDPDVALRAAERKRPGQGRDRPCFLAAFRQG